MSSYPDPNIKFNISTQPNVHVQHII